ncbi:hypothetical protein BRC75_02710 [Halobacteriales archaeon QH_7_69_31]|nr:MAG: hypothetical protein BRC75_02710 [Halobacteriales archaeon QH_7_69_31]
MIPDGDLVRARVVTDLAAPLEDALDRRLDGYAVLASRDAMLADDEDRGVITFEAGVPALSYHVGTDRGGPPALADIGAGPHRLELYHLDPAHLEVPHATDELRVPPGMPADRLAGDPDLADRTRRVADEPSAPDDDARPNEVRPRTVRAGGGSGATDDTRAARPNEGRPRTEQTGSDATREQRDLQG